MNWGFLGFRGGLGCWFFGGVGHGGVEGNPAMELGLGGGERAGPHMVEREKRGWFQRERIGGKCSLPFYSASFFVNKREKRGGISALFGKERKRKEN